jgi:hypothetical protein
MLQTELSIPSYEKSDPVPSCTASSGSPVVPSEFGQMPHNCPEQKIEFNI